MIDTILDDEAVELNLAENDGEVGRHHVHAVVEVYSARAANKALRQARRFDGLVMQRIPLLESDLVLVNMVWERSTDSISEGRGRKDWQYIKGEVFDGVAYDERIQTYTWKAATK